MISYKPNIFKNKTILVTGGTGTLGRNFIKFALQNLNFKKIIVYSRDEQKHFKMKNLMSSRKLRFFLGDIRDYERLLFAMKGVDFVVHAAANKHVRLAEYNPMECIKTNVLGTENVVKAAIETNVSHALLISSDKAVSSINLYGSTKSLAEKLFVNANNLIGNRDLRFSVARYGNVAGSEGSVLQLYNNLYANKKKLPLTDKEMTRFWVTIDQCINFIFGCFSRMQGGEIFIPKLPSIRIKDLIKSFGKEYEIIGLQGNEKIDEIMFSLEESSEIIEFDNFFILPPLLEFFIGRISGKDKNLTQKIIKNKFMKTNHHEVGQKLKERYRYSSGSNTFLTIKEISAINNKIINSIEKKDFLFF